jgi:hypothetical protein
MWRLCRLAASAPAAIPVAGSSGYPDHRGNCRHSNSILLFLSEVADSIAVGVVDEYKYTPVDSIASHISRNLSGWCGGVAACRRWMDDIGIRVFGLATEELINNGQFVSHSDGTSLKSNPSSDRKSFNVRSPVLHSVSVCFWCIVSCTSFLVTNASYRIPSTPVRNDTVVVIDDVDWGCPLTSTGTIDSLCAKMKHAPMAASTAKKQYGFNRIYSRSIRMVIP